MKSKIIYFMISFFISFVSCKKDEHTPIVSGGKPGAISNYSVKNLPGAAEISYTIPDDKVAYVLAEYETREGIKREAKSSKYGSDLKVDGFPKAGEYKVTLYAVGRDEKKSEPLVLSVNPLKPPFIEAFETLKMSAAFGGVEVAGINLSESSLVLSVVVQDSTGDWAIVDQYYTSIRDMVFTTRGFEAVPRKFGVFVRDQYQNYSDTLFVEITPYAEAMIDMSNFYETNFPGDTYEPSGNNPLEDLFDGRVGQSSYGFYSSKDYTVPQHFTIFLQDTYKLSRFRIWGDNDVPYESAQPKHIRIWGSMDPNPNGEFDSTWFVMGDYDDWKPSGLPTGERTQEDIDRFEAGSEFTFGLNVPPARYIRFETLSTWGGQAHIYISEMTLWGSKQ